MSNRSDMSDSQDTVSSASAFRDDEGDKEVIKEMYEAAEQMGEDMPIGLRGNFEYRGARERIRFEEAEGTD